MLRHPFIWYIVSLLPILLVAAQQECYFGPGASNRGPSNLVPCLEGTSACCLLGDTCLSGNTCYNFETGDLYQYGCTDITYESPVCPFKCGWNTTLSPWTALEYCVDLGASVNNTWVCHAPESCGCAWNATNDLLVLSPRGCKEMGSDARVALYAPSTLAPYVSLPSTIGGSTGYYSPTKVSGTSTWVETAVPGYTPESIVQLTTYGIQPTAVVLIDPNQNASASTAAAARTFTATSMDSASTSGSPSPAATGTTTPPPSSPSGLSTAAKIGISIGSAAGICLILAIIALTLSHRRHRRHTAPPQQQQQPPGVPSMSSSSGDPKPFYPYQTHSPPFYPPAPSESPGFYAAGVPSPGSTRQYSPSEGSPWGGGVGMDVRGEMFGGVVRQTETAELEADRGVAELESETGVTGGTGGTGKG